LHYSAAGGAGSGAGDGFGTLPFTLLGGGGGGGGGASFLSDILLS